MTKSNNNNNNDMINNPSHYQGTNGIECIDAIEAALSPEGFADFLRGTIIKYTFRLGKKDSSSENAGKAAWFANKLKEHLANLSSVTSTPTALPTGEEMSNWFLQRTITKLVGITESDLTHVPVPIRARKDTNCNQCGGSILPGDDNCYIAPKTGHISCCACRAAAAKRFYDKRREFSKKEKLEKKVDNAKALWEAQMAKLAELVTKE